MQSITTPGTVVIIKDTHRGLWYEDGKLIKILEAGKYRLPQRENWFTNRARVEIVLVDIRDRDLTIKGQEILTADKVAIRVSILVQFRVIDPRAAIQTVESYEDRLYSDVQLAARRSLATMSLEEILTNRNRLSEDILLDVKEAAAGYGVEIRRADVKDLAFPGNLQEIMNRVLAAERNSQAQLVEARTRAEVEQIQAQAKAQTLLREAEMDAQARILREKADLEVARSKTDLEVELHERRQRMGEILASQPALLRLEELETLRDLARNSNARIYIGFDRHWKQDEADA